MWSIIGGGVAKLIEGWFTTKQAEQEAKTALASQKQKGSDDYDIQAQKNMMSSLKDEYLILVHTFLIWGYGIPSPELHQALDNVWEKMGEAPTEWWIIYAGMVISTFGLRFMSNRVLNKK